MSDLGLDMNDHLYPDDPADIYEGLQAPEMLPPMSPVWMNLDNVEIF